MPVFVTAYASRNLVLLAYDWPPADECSEFRGFMIERTPAIGDANGNPSPQSIERTNLGNPECLVHKSYWWDASIGANGHGTHLQYRVTPVIGSQRASHLLDQEAGRVDVLVP